MQTGAVAEKFPVIFYIHGGEFEHGASNTFPGHMLAAVGDVVVVTVNYRLGALGDLSCPAPPIFSSPIRVVHNILHGSSSLLCR